MIVISTDVVVVCVGAKRFCQCHKIFVTATEYFFFLREGFNDLC